MSLASHRGCKDVVSNPRLPAIQQKLDLKSGIYREEKVDVLVNGNKGNFEVERGPRRDQPWYAPLSIRVITAHVTHKVRPRIQHVSESNLLMCETSVRVSIEVMRVRFPFTDPLDVLPCTPFSRAFSPRLGLDPRP